MKPYLKLKQLIFRCWKPSKQVVLQFLAILNILLFTSSKYYLDGMWNRYNKYDLKWGICVQVSKILLFSFTLPSHRVFTDE